MRTPRLIPAMLPVTSDSLCRANHGFGNSLAKSAARRTAGLLGPAVISSCLPVIGGSRGSAVSSLPMYRYDVVDKTLVNERVAQFRDQTRRFLAGELSEDEFRRLRLRNGLYLQRHAPMLRVAIPYGLLSATQLRAVGSIARRYDRGYGHFTTRQNIQFNWPKLDQVPDILAELAEVEMHTIQTSGN